MLSSADQCVAWPWLVCLFADAEFPLTLHRNVYWGMMRGEFDIGPRDSGHSEPRGHKKTFLLSVVPIVRHKRCFLQSVTRTLQNA